MTLFRNQLKKYVVQGYSLVEILMVLGLFSGIATLSLGALFNAQSVNTKLLETQTILDNMNLSLQTVTRDIRFGSDFYCTSSLPVGLRAAVPTVRKNCTNIDAPGTVLVFKPSDATSDLDRVAYYVSNGVLYKDVYPYLGSTTILQMTSDDVTVNSLFFNVDGANTSNGSLDTDDASQFDYRQPIITIRISGTTKPTKANMSPTTFELQTAVSAREIDNK